MTTLLPQPTNFYRQNIAQVASQAAIHLHNQVASIGTALYDRHGTLIFNNDVLHYVSEGTLFSLIVECLSDPAVIHLQAIGNVMVCTAALGQHHVFVIAGKEFEQDAIDQFLRRLRQVLPSTVATDD